MHRIYSLFTRRSERDKLFKSPRFQRLNGAALAYVFYCFRAQPVLSRSNWVRVQKNAAGGERWKKGHERRTSRERAAVSPIKPHKARARGDNARNSLHSAYKISQTKARRPRSNGRFPEEAHPPSRSPIYRDFVPARNTPKFRCTWMCLHGIRDTDRCQTFPEKGKIDFTRVAKPFNVERG